MKNKIIESGDLRILAQLIDNLNKLIPEIERTYNKKDAEGFGKTKENFLDLQEKISKIIK